MEDEVKQAEPPTSHSPIEPHCSFIELIYSTLSDGAVHGIYFRPVPPVELEFWYRVNRWAGAIGRKPDAAEGSTAIEIAVVQVVDGTQVT